MIPTGEATAMLPTGSKTKPITVIGTEKIRGTFDELCLQQAINSRLAPGVTDLILNPDGHCGYGAPIGCVMTSPTHIYPGPVGVDSSMLFANAHRQALGEGNATLPNLDRLRNL